VIASEYAAISPTDHQFNQKHLGEKQIQYPIQPDAPHVWVAGFHLGSHAGGGSPLPRSSSTTDADVLTPPRGVAAPVIRYMAVNLARRRLTTRYSRRTNVLPTPPWRAGNVDTAFSPENAWFGQSGRETIEGFAAR
jgi:hypothetical protein